MWINAVRLLTRNQVRTWEGGEHPEIAEAIVGFVITEVRVLMPLYSLSMRMALGVFHIQFFLTRHIRQWTEDRAAARVQRAWEESRIAPLRQVMQYVRLLSLLAYGDQPSVIQRAQIDVEQAHLLMRVYHSQTYEGS